MAVLMAFPVTPATLRRVMQADQTSATRSVRHHMAVAPEPTDRPMAVAPVAVMGRLTAVSVEDMLRLMGRGQVAVTEEVTTQTAVADLVREVTPQLRRIRSPRYSA